MRPNPAQVRREALKARETAGEPLAGRTVRCPDCHDDIDEARTREDMQLLGLTVQKPPGWHDCPASKSNRPAQAQTSYDWRSHGR